MQRDLSDKNTLDHTLNPINDARRFMRLIEQHQIIQMQKKKLKKLEI